ncbi:endonuclease V [Lysobacter enzymogenes]|uniref:endonuclease V n=1 Tax=Lysobacter enzymogenes TaxID=69 RepID=UPI001AF2639F|nr:endonuclease V [Lysobacter enzymogenes]QQQ02160.1 endonuclease V [Lysobacter enzymogenes]
MILATDVHYFDGRARAAGVLFADWGDALAAATLTADIDAVADYQPGAFYRRELPCLAALLAKLDAPPDCIVVDGHAWLDGAGRPGLGAHLWESLQRRVAVVGVAKTRFVDTPAEAEVLRGGARPLYVTAAGLEPALARAAVARMAGAHRLPDLLKQADRLARGG